MHLSQGRLQFNSPTEQALEGLTAGSILSYVSVHLSQGRLQFNSPIEQGLKGLNAGLSDVSLHLSWQFSPTGHLPDYRLKPVIRMFAPQSGRVAV